MLTTQSALVRIQETSVELLGQLGKQRPDLF